MGAKGLAHFPRAGCLFLLGAQLHSTVQGRGDGRLLHDPSFHYCPFYAVLLPGFLVNIVKPQEGMCCLFPTPSEAHQAELGKLWNISG